MAAQGGVNGPVLVVASVLEAVQDMEINMQRKVLKSAQNGEEEEVER